MPNWLSWAAGFAMMPTTMLFAWTGYRVWTGNVVVHNRSGSLKTPLRYALWTLFSGGFAALNFWNALNGR